MEKKHNILIYGFIALIFLSVFVMSRFQKASQTEVQKASIEEAEQVVPEKAEPEPAAEVEPTIEAEPEPAAEVEPTVARAMFTHLVFLPLYPEMPFAEVQRLADVVIKSTGERFAPPAPAPSLSGRHRREPEHRRREAVPAT